MPRPRRPYLLRETNRHGTAVWYVRRGAGPRIRIRGEYGSDEFNRAYDAAVVREKPEAPNGPSRGTLAWLIDLHMKSGYWAGIALTTRQKRERVFRRVIADAGTYPITAVDRISIKNGIDKRRATPSQARSFLATMHALFKWAVESDLVKTDPTAGVITKRAKGGGHKPWTDEDVAAFEARWPRGTRERVMFDVFLYTGFRIGDAARVGRQHVRGGVISIATEKNGTPVTIPLLRPLAETLKAGPTGDLAFIATATGRPLTKKAIGNIFTRACRAAGVNKSAHGIRKAAATRAANNGATVHELEAIFGWTGGQMAALYTRDADRKSLALAAAGKMDRSIPAPGDTLPRTDDKLVVNSTS